MTDVSELSGALDELPIIEKMAATRVFRLCRVAALYMQVIGNSGITTTDILAIVKLILDTIVAEKA